MQQMMGGGAETPKAQSRNVAADGDEDGPHTVSYTHLTLPTSDLV